MPSAYNSARGKDAKWLHGDAPKTRRQKSVLRRVMEGRHRDRDWGTQLWTTRVGGQGRAYPVIPSRANAFFTTSIAPLYVPGAAVCRRVLVRSKGCPAAHGFQPRPGRAAEDCTEGHERKELRTYEHCADASEASRDEGLDRLCGRRAVDLFCGGRVALAGGAGCVRCASDLRARRVQSGRDGTDHSCFAAG